MVKKIFKYLFFGLAAVVVLILLFVAVSVVPLDRTPNVEQEHYEEMQEHLDSITNVSIPDPKDDFSVGYSTVNITPHFKTSTAGYGKRKGAYFTEVHDSIFVRAMVITNDTDTVAVVSADMLIIPPTLTQVLKARLPSIGFDLSQTFLGATHTHNSVGNWGENLIGELYAGSYKDSLVQFLADRFIHCIAEAKKNILPATLKTARIPVSGAVNNRLTNEGKVDSLLHVLEITRSDSAKLVLTSFTAHATCLYARNLELSRDYPGKLVDELEANGYDFAMFMAGAVGSHGCRGPEDGWEKIDYLGNLIADAFLERKDSLKAVNDSTLQMFMVPLELDEPQVKISEDWRVRPWLFRTFFGEYPAHLTALRIGDLIMLGTPCDFSGELTAPIYQSARDKGMQAMVTSFNGGYIGYITLDKHYDREHYETRVMNWFGPGNGAYLTENLREMVKAISEDE